MLLSLFGAFFAMSNPWLYPSRSFHRKQFFESSLAERHECSSENAMGLILHKARPGCPPTDHRSLWYANRAHQTRGTPRYYIRSERPCSRVIPIYPSAVRNREDLRRTAMLAGWEGRPSPYMVNSTYSKWPSESHVSMYSGLSTWNTLRIRVFVFQNAAVFTWNTRIPNRSPRIHHLGGTHL